MSTTTEDKTFYRWATINEDDIANAEKNNPEKCAMVVAFKRVNPNYANEHIVVSVSKRIMWISGTPYPISNGELITWLEKFDKGESVGPISFTFSEMAPDKSAQVRTEHPQVELVR